MATESIISRIVEAMADALQSFQIGFQELAELNSGTPCCERGRFGSRIVAEEIIGRTGAVDTSKPSDFGHSCRAIHVAETAGGRTAVASSKMGWSAEVSPEN